MPVPTPSSFQRFIDPAARRRRGRHSRGGGPSRGRFGLVAGGSAGATAGVFALVLAFIVTPQGPDAASIRLADHTQSLTVSEQAADPAVVRDAYGSVDLEAEYIADGSNFGWAKLVLLYGDFPVTDENVAVLTRWMRQENDPRSWWTRNNPLNNGYGSGGGSGLGSYSGLASAAKYCAESLNTYSGYSSIRAALKASSDASTTARAIWYSPWASSHYAYGSHWSTAPVQQVKAPASAW